MSRISRTRAQALMRLQRLAALAAISIGRYLTPKIYLGYAIGLKDSIDVFSLRYELTDRWTVAAESGRETRAKVSYRRETGDAKIPIENQEKEEP